MKRIREPIPENLKVKLNGEDEWKKVLQILEDDGYMWGGRISPTKLIYPQKTGVKLCSNKHIYCYTKEERNQISAQSFIDTYSEKLPYEVGDVVVVTEGLGGDPVGTVTEILRVQEDSNVWVKAITKYVVTGWFSLPNGIRPATENEIKVYQQSQKPIDNRTKLSFKTEDGYDLYDGDKVWWIYRTSKYEKWGWKSSRKEKEIVVEEHKEYIGEPWRIFHSKGNAEKYIEEQNRPKEPEYKVGDWVVVTGDGSCCTNYDREEYSIGTIAKIVEKGWNGAYNRSLKLQSNSYANQHWIAWDEGRGDSHIRPATPEEIAKATGNSTVKKETKDEWKVGDVIPAQWLSGIHRFRSWCGVANIAGNVVNDVEVKRVKEGWACISVEKDIWLAPKSEYATYPNNSTVKELPLDEPWSIVTEDGVQISQNGTKAWQVKNGKVIPREVGNGTWKEIKNSPHPIFSTYDKAEEYRQKQCTSTVKESIPVERKWKVGDKFKTKPGEYGDTIVYTIKEKDYRNVTIEWISPSDNSKLTTITYTIEQADENWGKDWIPYNPEPIPVTVDNAYIGMKVVRGKDWSWGNDGNTTPDTVGEVVKVCTDNTNKYVMVMWSTSSDEKMYYIGEYERYDLYVASEYTVVTTNQQSQIKTQDNVKHNQISSNNQQSISKQQNNEEVITYIRANSTVIEGPRITAGEVITAMCKVKPQVIEK